MFYKNSVARKKVEIRRCTNQTQIGLHDYTESITKRQEKKKRIGYIAFFVKQGIKGEHFCQRKTYNRCNSELSTWFSNGLDALKHDRFLCQPSCTDIWIN